MKLYLDPGHGGTDPGAQGNGLNEKNINLDIARRIRDILEREYRDAYVRMSRTDDSSISLSGRTNEANSWGADYFLSIHCNSFNGAAQGYEDYIHSSLPDSSETADYQHTMHVEITKVNQLRNRGKKKANFHVLRETAMPALLTENGFIDNAEDADLMKDPSWRQTVARGHVNGLAKVFNLKKKEGTSTLYKVVAGSFQSKENAENRVNHLQSNGIDSYVAKITISGKQWYRVQAGAFSDRKNAEEQLAKVKESGVHDAYIIREDR
ncbi:N-acetylmuramoyl-L-alanine amidase [Lentibacillus salicampi]|uniref:N-acetylmuramoyl-L-alanine amidase n=1 Tax=Lentibacillus salicampi TaxID=175306 RepID=A0A4Y9AG54_9BACI|nr:N-acetylmuramoyl-L-alanine amidase [Lentibacillus salicampi]TFJ94352.1 N-acetylmuramoyl-L-alanine amidase [Lentibacillus salicampi]